MRTSNANFENTQATLHKDVCRCKKCNAESVVSINPDLEANKWECLVCKRTQSWIPSDEYKATVGVCTTLETATDEPQSIADKPKKNITLDSLVKLDYEEVCVMTTDEAIDTLIQCDEHAAKLNEIIGISSVNGYKAEFVSGVVPDIGKLRNLKKWLWEVIRREYALSEIKKSKL